MQTETSPPISGLQRLVNSLIPTETIKTDIALEVENRELIKWAFVILVVGTALMLIFQLVRT